MAVALVRPKKASSLQATSIINLQQAGVSEALAHDDGSGPR